MTLKTVLITGATRGVGLSAVEHFVQDGGWRIIIASRNKQALEDTERILVKLDPNVQILTYILDLESSDSIRSFVEAFVADNHELDVFVNNAGIACSTKTFTEEGLETTFAVNHVGVWLLTWLLVAKRHENGQKVPRRIVFVCSSVVKMKNCVTDPNFFDNPDFPQKSAYATSKLFNFWTALLLPSQLKSHLSIPHMPEIVRLCPGFIPYTGLFRSESWAMRTMLSALRIMPFTETLKNGGRRVYLSATKEGLDGALVCTNDATPQDEFPNVTDHEKAVILWDKTCDIVKMPELKYKAPEGENS